MIAIKKIKTKISISSCICFFSIFLFVLICNLYAMIMLRGNNESTCYGILNMLLFLLLKMLILQHTPAIFVLFLRLVSSFAFSILRSPPNRLLEELSVGFFASRARSALKSHERTADFQDDLILSAVILSLVLLITPALLGWTARPSK